jgi:hypothetical protein
VAKETLTDTFLKFARDVAGDKEIKTELLSSAISGVTGISPVIDRSNPQVTYVRLKPEHGAMLEAVLLKRIRKTPSGVPVTVKLDVAPAMKPIAFKYVAVPVIGLLATAFLLGRYFFPRR